MMDVVTTTLLVLPSFISPLMPFLLVIAGFFLNYKLNSSNEIIILKQYFSLKNNFLLSIILSLGIITLYLINNEFFSVNLYQKYKVKELEIRNNLKLGIPSVSEFHIENEVSIFFEKQSNNKFYDVEAIIFEDGQFINSNNVEIEIDKKNYNLIFYHGERIILNESEKSKTIFDKFVYSIENNEIEMLMMDKEHFNTLQLLEKEDIDFYHHAHNRIYQYFLVLVIALASFKIILLYFSKKNIFKYYAFLFLIVLFIQVINSYLIFLLNNNSNFSLSYYYILNFTILSFFCYFMFKLNDNS